MHTKVIVFLLLAFIASRADGTMSMLHLQCLTQRQRIEQSVRRFEASRQSDPQFQAAIRASQVAWEAYLEAMITARFPYCRSLSQDEFWKITGEYQLILMNRRLSDLAEIRGKEEDGEPGATDNPADAQRLREDY